MDDNLELDGRAQEAVKKGRHRKKRPGKPRNSQMKREKRKAAMNGEAQPTERPTDAHSAGRAAGKKKDSTATPGKDFDKDYDNRVWVGGLPPHSDEQLLLEHFSPCGPIRNIKLILNTRLKFRGAAFITFKKASGVQAALKMDVSEFHEKLINVRKAAAP